MLDGRDTHWRRHHVELRGLREKATAAERRRCELLVQAANNRPSQDWSPTVGAALKAGYRWLNVYCAGCGQVAPVDLEAIDRHPWTGLTGLILSLRCDRCQRNGPFPQLLHLSRHLSGPIRLKQQI